MASSNISTNEAQQLANIIADKAFEHLIKDKQVALKQRIGEIYQSMLDNIGHETVQKIVDYGMTFRSDSIHISIKNSQECDVQLRHEFDKECDHLTNYYNRLQIFDDVLYDEMSEKVHALATLNSKRHDLWGELVGQMKGRSAKTMKNAWPEAEGIFNDFFGTDGVSGTRGLTSPLEQLLARFLPMLPAPTGA